MTAVDELPDSTEAPAPVEDVPSRLQRAVAARGLQQLAHEMDVSPRSLQNWTAGHVPTKRHTHPYARALRWLDANVPPRAFEAPPGDPRPGGPAVAPRGPDRGPSSEHPTARRWGRIWAVTGGLVVIVAAAVLLSLWLAGVFDDDRLPTGPVGSERTETTGRYGANTFSDPRTLSDPGHVDAHTDVTVRCRYLLPNLPSVSPDGFWYLVVDDGATRWAPANSFLNGDVYGGPTFHNTDLHVPVCR